MPALRALKDSLFKPPYRMLPFAVFVYFALAFLLHPYSPLHIGHLDDPDDYMRLNQVVNWLSGQGWYDLSQPRMSPGANTVVHWSRLVDIPIALLTLLFKPFMGLRGGALLAAMFVPSILFGLLLGLVPMMARVFVGRDRANLASVLVLFAPVLLFNFTPGRVDHHGYQILIAGFGLVCLERLTRDHSGWKAAIAVAVAFACGLWIGTEALPWLIIFIACLGIMAAWEGGFVARNAAIFGAAFAAACDIVLVLAVPSAQLGSKALSWFSLGDVVFAGLTGLVFIAGWSVGAITRNRVVRIVVLAVTGLLALGALLKLVPDARIGPFADYYDFNSTVALANIGEAIPLSHAFPAHYDHFSNWLRALGTFSGFLLVPCLGLFGLIWFSVTALPRQRVIALIYGVYLVSATLLTLFWQVRVAFFMQLFTLAPLTWLGWKLWQVCRAHLDHRALFWAEIAVFLLLGPLEVVLIPAIYGKTVFYPDMVLFPVARGAPVCPLKPVTQFLKWSYIDRPYTVLSGMNEGPELLFNTHDNVIGGNFNVLGNQDVFNFFNARDDDAAKAIIGKWKVDLVLTCRTISAFYAGLDHMQLGKTAFLSNDGNGKLRIVSSLDRPTLIERLIIGKAPDWLKPIEIPNNADYLLFEVEPSVSPSTP